MQSGCVLKVKLAALLGALAFSSVFAAEVSSDDALCAVKGWVNLKEALGGDFDANPASVTAYDGEDGKGKFYVVTLEGGGYVVASGDDEVTPILAYSREGIFEASEKNPLWCLLAGRAANEAERLAASASTSGGRRLAASATPTSGNAAKWSRLRAAGGADGGKLRLGKSSSAPTDLRVPELLHSDWSQEEIGNYNNGNYPDCFNLYTPNHYPCGCVATSGAQLMRYFEWPKTSVTPRTFPCYTNNVPVDLTMMGGTYDWANMPLNINTMYANGTSPTVTTYREAIGKLTYDVGVSVSMSYDSDGSGSSISRFPDSFKNVFGYSGAVYINDPEANDGFKKALLPNLDAKRPCGLGISGSGGHAVVADGYGYSDGTLYVHINSGWAYAKSATAWYAPPTFDFSDKTTYTSVDTVVFNIFTNETRSSSIASGRVLDMSGNPVPGAAVTATFGGSVITTVTTDARGIYALVLPPNDETKTYSVTATCPGYRNPSTISVSAAKTTGWNGLYSTNANSYDNDISIEVIPPVYAKLVEGSFHYYTNISCSSESELQSGDAPSSVAGCIVLFANDAEYQALVPYTNELATASGGMAHLQNNVTLTADTDWSAMDFDMNGKAVTLCGYDLKVRKPVNGRFSAGNLINPLSASGNATSTWSAGNGWWNVGSAKKENALWWNFTPPKSRNIYINCKTKRYDANFVQYVYFAVGGQVFMDYPRTDDQGEKWWGPWTKAVTGGTEIQAMVRRDSGYSMIGFVTISPESHLTFDVPEGEEVDTSTLAFGGASTSTYEGDYGLGLEIHKTGKGTLLLNKSWTLATGTSGGTSVVVEEGIVKKTPGITAGGQNARIRVEDGGQFDVCGADSSVNYDFTIAGSGPDGLGALVNNTVPTDEDVAAFPVRNVTLSTNAVIGGTQPFSLRNGNWAATTTTLNGYTLAYSAATVYAGNVTYNGGNVVVSNGTEFVFQGHNSAAPSADVTIYGRLVMNNGGFSTARSLIFAEGSQLVLSDTATSGSIPTTVVTGKYAPATQCVTNGTCTLTTQPVQLGDASHLATEFDLSAVTGVFDGSNTTFYAGSTITVGLGTREFNGSELLVSWPGMSTATFAVDDANKDSLGVWAKPEGLYIFPGKVPSYVKYDVENDCLAFYDEDVNPYVGEWTLGMDYMKALFANDVEFQGLASHKAELEAANVQVFLQNNITLTTDTDWSAMDFNLNGKVVALQGWDLIVRKPQGEGRITSGNLINQTAFSVAYGAWNAGGGWYGFAGSQANSYGNRDVFQSFTVPKARDVYLQFRVHSWNNSGYNQYVSAGIDSVNNLIKDFQSGTKTSASSYYRTTGILKRSGLAEGSTHELQFTNSGGYTYVGDIFLCPTSKLIFDIPENEEYDLDGITLGGASDVDFSGIGLCVCKTGKGLLTMSKANPRFGGSGITALVVEDGLVKKAPGVTCGASGSTVQVNDGGQFDVCGADSSVTYDFTIAGSGPDGLGALVNNTELTGEDIAAFPVRNVTLSTNAVIGGSQPFSLRNGNWAATTTTLNGYTLTYTNATVYAGNVTYNNGSIVIPSGTEFVFQGHNSAAPSADVTIYGQLVMNNGGFTSARSLVFAEGAQLVLSDTATSGSIPTPVITGKYAPANQCVTNGTCTLATQPVQLGDASHLATEFDLSLGSGTFDGSNTTFYAGSTVTVNLGTREFSGSELLVAWPEMSTATFAVDEANEDRLGVWAKPEGLYIFPGKVPSFVKYDVANDCWMYYNEDVSPYVGEWTLGMDYMRALFANDAEFQGLASHKAELEAANVQVLLQNDITLTADTDWRAIDFDMNGKSITLRGYDLKVHKPVNGRFSAGNLIDPFSKSGNGSSTWSAGGGWWNVGTASKNDALWWYFTPPKTRNIYIACKTKKYNSTYGQYLYFDVGGSVYLNYTYTGPNANEVWRGPWSKTVTGGAQIRAMVRRNNGYCMIGFVTISPESHLTFDVPEGEIVDTSTLAFGGASASTYDGYYGLGLQIHKTGKGTLLLNKAWTMAAQTGGLPTSVVVEEGVVKKASGMVAGGQYSRIRVEDGGQFDLNGRTYHDYDYTLAGSGPDGAGALINTASISSPWTVDDSKNGILRHVTLGADATIGGSESFGMIFYDNGAHTMTMNNKTVTYAGTEIFAGQMNYSGDGKIVIATNGWLQSCTSSATAGGCDVEVYGILGQQDGKVLSPVKSLIFADGGKFYNYKGTPGTVTVYGTYAPNVEEAVVDGSTVLHPKVQLGDASHLNATLDLSQWTTTFDDSEEGSLTFYAGTAEAPAEMTVTVEIGDRTAGLGEYAYRWKEQPADTVKFVPSQNMRRRGIHVLADNDGIRFKTGLTIHIR